MATTKKVHKIVPLLILVALAVACTATTKINDDTAQDVHSESWAGWAKEKISEGLGLKAEEAKDAAMHGSDATIDAAKNTKDKVTDTAKRSSEAAADAAKNAKDKISDTAKRSSEAAADAAKNTKDKVSDTARRSSEAAADAAKNAKDKITDTAKNTKDTATGK